MIDFLNGFSFGLLAGIIIGIIVFMILERIEINSIKKMLEKDER